MYTQENNGIFKYKQYFYAICAISLLLISFRFYYAINYSMFGMTQVILQVITTYFIAKSISRTNFNTILISTILVTVLFILISIYYAVFDYFEYINNLIIENSVFCLTGFVILFIGYIDKHVEQPLLYKRNYILKFVLFFGLGIMLLAGSTQNTESFQIPKELFIVGVFIFQALCGYSLFCISKKWYMLGSILVALYYAAIRLYMINFCTDIVSDSGWAVTYVKALLTEYLLINGIFAFIIITVLFLSNKHKCCANTPL